MRAKKELEEQLRDLLELERTTRSRVLSQSPEWRDINAQIRVIQWALGGEEEKPAPKKEKEKEKSDAPA